MGELQRRGREELDRMIRGDTRRAGSPASSPVRARIESRFVANGTSELTADQMTWADHARMTLRRAGYRHSGARDVLIELLAREECALTVNEIDSRLAAWLRDGALTRSVGVASIYRGVELLQDLRLVARVDLGDGAARYERAAVAHSDHHHHFVCDKCGLLLPFDDDALEEAIDGLESRLGFETKEHEVTLHGTCRDCR